MRGEEGCAAVGLVRDGWKVGSEVWCQICPNLVNDEQSVFCELCRDVEWRALQPFQCGQREMGVRPQCPAPQVSPELL